MASRAEVERVNALIAEAVALCEAAQERFKQIHEELLQAINEGRRLTSQQFDDERTARRALFDARVQLYARERKRRLITKAD